MQTNRRNLIKMIGAGIIAGQAVPFMPSLLGGEIDYRRLKVISDGRTLVDNLSVAPTSVYRKLGQATIKISLPHSPGRE